MSLSQNHLYHQILSDSSSFTFLTLLFSPQKISSIYFLCTTCFRTQAFVTCLLFSNIFVPKHCIILPLSEVADNRGKMNVSIFASFLLDFQNLSISPLLEVRSGLSEIEALVRHPGPDSIRDFQSDQPLKSTNSYNVSNFCFNSTNYVWQCFK